MFTCLIICWRCIFSGMWYMWYICMYAVSVMYLLECIFLIYVYVDYGIVCVVYMVCCICGVCLLVCNGIYDICVQVAMYYVVWMHAMYMQHICMNVRGGSCVFCVSIFGVLYVYTSTYCMCCTYRICGINTLMLWWWVCVWYGISKCMNAHEMCVWCTLCGVMPMCVCYMWCMS